MRTMQKYFKSQHTRTSKNSASNVLTGQFHSAKEVYVLTNTTRSVFSFSPFHEFSSDFFLHVQDAYGNKLRMCTSRTNLCIFITQYTTVLLLLIPIWHVSRMWTQTHTSYNAGPKVNRTCYSKNLTHTHIHELRHGITPRQINLETKQLIWKIIVSYRACIGLRSRDHTHTD